MPPSAAAWCPWSRRSFSGTRPAGQACAQWSWGAHLKGMTKVMQQRQGYRSIRTPLSRVKSGVSRATLAGQAHA
eukprot:scaffold99540_cov15-Tisochrysis_lutea.AAC.1